MFSRLKAVIARIRGKTSESAASDYDISYSPEEESLRRRLEENKHQVSEFLEPVKSNWKFIEETLLWKNQFPACFCFFLISGIFWKFIGMKFRKSALVLGAFLLANGISGDVRANCWQLFQTNLNLQVKNEERLPFSFDELCLGIASVWVCYTQVIDFFQDLKTYSSSKFYCMLAVLLFAVLTLFTYFPVIEFMYVLVCGLFFYPSLNHYGFIDKIEARIDFLSAPVVRHWENNRTKRMRDSLIASKQSAADDDTDDEFLLDRNAFTTVLPSAGEGNREQYNKEIESARLSDFKNDDTEDDDDYYDESHFAQGLALQSMSNFDNMMEPYDEFHDGLKFPSMNDSSRMNTEHILNAAANNLDTDDECIDDLPYEVETDGAARQGLIPEVPTSRPISSPADDYEIRFRNRPSPRKANQSTNFEIESANKHPPTSLDSEVKERMRAVEADFEFLDHSDLCDMDAVESETLPSNEAENRGNEQAPATYTQAGIDSVTKFFGLQ